MQSVKKVIMKRSELKNIMVPLFKKFIRIYMFLCNKITGIKANKIVFISFNGRSYSDNPKVISEKLHEMYPEFSIVWLLKNPEEKKNIIPNYIKCVKTGSIKAYRELATAKFWVDNFAKPTYIFKSEKQVYIQTWHGDRGFKKILYDYKIKLPNGQYKEVDLIEPKICDLVISGSVFAEKVYKTAFRYKGEILKVGIPRNDQLITNNPNKVQDIRDSLHISEDKKILLYAPTFRDSKRSELQGLHINIKEVLTALEDKTGYNWMCLLRSHAASGGFGEFNSIDNEIKDVSSYEDMADLLLISDFLITDYSSCCGDFALLNRPIILFQNNREQYVEDDRPLYFDIDKSPFIVVNSQEELIYKIKSLDMNLAHENCKDILKFYGAYETGNSAEEIVKYIKKAIL